MLASYAGPNPLPAQTNKERAITTEWVNYFARRYAKTQNAVFAWDAIAVILGQYRCLPWWLAYLKRAARNIQTLSRTNIPSGELAPFVYQALEFVPGRGGLNPFREILDTAHDMMIAFDVLTEIRGGKKLDFALTDVARDHPARCARTPKCQSLSRAAVSVIWNAHKSQFDR